MAKTKKKIWLWFLLALLLLPFVFLYYVADMDTIKDFFNFFNEKEPAQKVESYVLDQGSLELYFCPRQDCEKAFLEFLDSANESLHCALFEIDLPSVQKKLLEKSKIIEVNIVTDDQYLKQFNYSFVKADRNGLMHNKFCIIDGKKTSTGSMNPTENCAHKNNNNLLLLDSKILAQNYEAEFQEMWNGTFKSGNKVLNPAVQLGNISLKNYFCPEDYCARQIEEELKKAENSIYFMTFSFTHQGIANALLLKNLENVTIKGIMEEKQISEYSRFSQLLSNGMEIIKDHNKYNMHHKVFIIDNETVIAGSFNPSNNGDFRNDENIIIIKNKELAARFLEEFEILWNGTMQ